MTSEIVPFVDGISTDYCGGQDSNVRRPSQRLGEYIPALDLFRAAAKPSLQSHLVGGDAQISKFLASENGHKHITQLSPTPSSVNALVDQINIPSVLLLHGCDQLFLQPTDFPFAKFKNLTSLEISGVTNLTTLPGKAISQMTQLQTLNLSYLPIRRLPEDDFLSSLTNLRSLVLRGCSNLSSLPRFPQLTALQSLDLSHLLLIETLPEGIFSDLKELRWVILSGCSKLCSLPSTQPLEHLRVLDLSHCTTLREIEYMEFVHPHLEVLDLSSTALLYSPNLAKIPREAVLFFRDTKMTKLNGYSDLNKVLDLSGAQNMKVFDCFPKCHFLEALDLSRTEIDSLGFFSVLPDIRYLILRECNRLRKLPPVYSLQFYGLEVLDISGCEILIDLPEDLKDLKRLKELNLSGCICLKELREGLFDQMSCLEKLDLSKTHLTHLPSLSNLTSLRTLNISHTSVEQIPGLSNLKNLIEFFFADCPRLKGVPAHFQTISSIELRPCCRLEGRKSMPNELHLVSTFFSKLIFDRFKRGFSTLVRSISNIQQEASQTSERRFRSIIADLNYILDKIDLLESSNNCTSAEELLNSLLEISSQFSFYFITPDLDGLRRTIVKLKLLVPPAKVVAIDKRKNKKGKKNVAADNKIDTQSKLILRSFLGTLEDPDRFFGTFEDPDHVRVSDTDLCSSYDSLTELERNCLLCFAIFPHVPEFTLINERILIHLWYAEGFIEPRQEVGSPNSTVEEIGRNILMVLQEKRFILRPVTHYGELRVCTMGYSVVDFVRERAKEKGLFQFDYKNGKLAPYVLYGSEWACLLKPRENLSPSSKLNLSNSSNEVQSLETVGTLFNALERNVNMRADIFSKMSNLIVLHLGKWGYLADEPIEVVDLKFLEALKNMKQLRLLNLEGFSTIKKLPDSVCTLKNLRILNIRDCSYLEELPAGIGSLENLTHLDFIGCHFLSKLPKGLRLLYKLEVLKGFVINYQIGGRQQEDTCTLRDLLKLERLRKLTLIVNSDKFPYNEDLRVFKEMMNLYNLRITWENDYDRHRASDDVVVQKALKHSIFQKMKCWEQRTRQQDTEEQLTSNHLNNLKKLSLYCFPLENAPNWLDPRELIKLERLVVMGGGLRTFVGDTNQNTWNVKTMRLGYLRNLDMDWEELRRIFSNMTHFQRFKCDIRNCPVSYQWKIEMEDHDKNEEEIEASRASKGKLFLPGITILLCFHFTFRWFNISDSLKPSNSFYKKIDSILLCFLHFNLAINIYIYLIGTSAIESQFLRESTIETENPTKGDILT